MILVIDDIPHPNWQRNIIKDSNFWARQHCVPNNWIQLVSEFLSFAYTNIGSLQNVVDYAVLDRSLVNNGLRGVFAVFCNRR